MNASKVFSEIYRHDRWTGGSGPGSSSDFCRPLSRWLRGYLVEHQIRSLVDVGCGDLQWMPAALSGLDVDYVGLDVVPELLEGHRQRMPADRFSFHVLDVATAPVASIPTGGLYWAKDVLQHWPSADVAAWLDRFFAARPDAHLVVVNCDGQTADERHLDARWHFAPLAGDRPPLAAYHPVPLFRWRGKTVHRLHHRSFAS
jgi:hypothetical protein